ncbi:MAG: penicillin-binding protein 2, partial [Erysipelotrichia bacterium]|nr:penicillin-binding protein 2 [Erysipelotrichia bacterium]
SLLSKKQLAKINEGLVDADKILEWKVKAVDVSSLDDHTKAVYQVKMRMDSVPSNQYKVIAEDVNESQVAYLSENSNDFPGFKATFDWKRNYSETGQNIKAVLGNVSTQTQGIPEEEQEYYLALGYELNDRVGTSGLEKTYESYLSGTKSVYDIKFDEHGVAYLEQSKAGKNGYDLTLTIDADYQNKMDALVMDKLKSFQSASVNSRISDIFLVAINPKTGAIVSMSGATKDRESGEFYSNPTGTYLSAFLVGSIVKPATLYMGLNEKVVTPGQQILDAPMNIKGTQVFKSYTNKGLINDLEAIRQSSNVYMAHIAIGLGGDQYVEGKGLNIKPETFSLMRTYYNMFGLGTKTGIDLPNEALGYVGEDNEAGKILYYSIGQYDSFTPMQVAQYVATIANGGKRVQPHSLSEVSEVNDPETIIYEFSTKILSTLLGDTSLLQRSKTGMELCVSSGSCQINAGNVGVSMAAKTGTAEAVYQVSKQVYEDVSNSSLIAYGPTEDPEIAFACVAPNANNTNTNVCSQVVEAAAKEYFTNYRNK